MGATHVRAWDGVRGGQVVAVQSSDERKLSGDLSSVGGNLDTTAEFVDFSNVSKYKDFAELLGDGSVDAVDLCLPTHLHAPMAIQALRAGKHVLVEKPMALSQDEADTMLAEANRAGKVLMVAHVLRFWPAYRGLREALESGQYGSPRSALFRRRCAAPSWSRWLGDKERSGGAVLDLLIHDVDYVLQLFGHPQRVSATGHLDGAAGIDILNAVLDYGSAGPAVTITGGWHHPSGFPFSMEFTVNADSATFDFDSATGPALKLWAKGVEGQDLALPGEDGFREELQYFADCCRTGAEPSLCRPADSAAALRLAALLEIARTRRGEWLSWQS
jgi:predicted dehydrogenase